MCAVLCPGPVCCAAALFWWMCTGVFIVIRMSVFLSGYRKIASWTCRRNKLWPNTQLSSQAWLWLSAITLHAADHLLHALKYSQTCLKHWCALTRMHPTECAYINITPQARTEHGRTAKYAKTLLTCTSLAVSGSCLPFVTDWKPVTIALSASAAVSGTSSAAARAHQDLFTQPKMQHWQWMIDIKRQSSINCRPCTCQGVHLQHTYSCADMLKNLWLSQERTWSSDTLYLAACSLILLCKIMEV